MGHTITATIQAKGERLALDGAVSYLGSDMFRVKGDTDNYRVSVSDYTSGAASCTCRWYTETGRACSHVFATLIAYRLDLYSNEAPELFVGDPFDGLS